MTSYLALLSIKSSLVIPHLLAIFFRLWSPELKSYCTLQTGNCKWALKVALKCLILAEFKSSSGGLCSICIVKFHCDSSLSLQIHKSKYILLNWLYIRVSLYYCAFKIEKCYSTSKILDINLVVSTCFVQFFFIFAEKIWGRFQ